MQNKNSLEYWKTTATSVNDAVLACKFNPANDHTQADAEFILKFAGSQTNILDLASGTGGIVNKIYGNVARVVCVEPFAEFTKHIVISSNIEIYNKTIAEFESADKFDLITMFGIMQYFNAVEATDIYQKYLHLLKNGGHIIVKNQFGVNEDVEVAGFSEEMQRNYYAQYRHLPKECAMLEQIGYRNVESFDIYPPDANRWENTHFYAIVAQK